MGSRVHARQCREQAEQIVCMISLEMVGYFILRSRLTMVSIAVPQLLVPELRQFHCACRQLSLASLSTENCATESWKLAVFLHASFFVPGANLSDDWSFWKEGYPALMITDTAFFRNPHYHRWSDLPQTLDYARMAAVVCAPEKVILSVGP